MPANTLNDSKHKYKYWQRIKDILNFSAFSAVK